MTPQLFIFLVAMGYLIWVTVRYFRRRGNKDVPFIEVIEDQAPERPKKERENDDDREWRRRVRAEIEEMTK